MTATSYSLIVAPPKLADLDVGPARTADALPSQLLQMQVLHLQYA
jgi:hypothetical protein